MAVFYTLYQNIQENSPQKGMWYARVKPVGTKTLKDIAEIIQRNASVKKSDVIAVLTELPEVMNDMLADGYRVKIDDFGSFKVGISCKPSTTAKTFNAGKNITKSRINFAPATTRKGSNGATIRALASSLEFREWGDRSKEKTEDE